jgi:hypothetical protein
MTTHCQQSKIVLWFALEILHCFVDLTVTEAVVIMVRLSSFYIGFIVRFGLDETACSLSLLNQISIVTIKIDLIGMTYLVRAE